jgi:hypothetical protein
MIWRGGIGLSRSKKTVNGNLLRVVFIAFRTPNVESLVYGRSRFTVPLLGDGPARGRPLENTGLGPFGLDSYPVSSRLPAISPGPGARYTPGKKVARSAEASRLSTGSAGPPARWLFAFPLASRTLPAGTASVRTVSPRGAQPFWPNRWPIFPQTVLLNAGLQAARELAIIDEQNSPWALIDQVLSLFQKLLRGASTAHPAASWTIRWQASRTPDRLARFSRSDCGQTLPHVFKTPSNFEDPCSISSG